VQALQRVNERRALVMVELPVIRRVGKQGGNLLWFVAMRECRQQRLDRVSQQDCRRSYTLSATVTTRAGRWRTCAVEGYVSSLKYVPGG